MNKSDAEFIDSIDRFVYNVSPDILRDKDGVKVRIEGEWIPVVDWKENDGPNLLRLAKHFYQMGSNDERWRLTRGNVEGRPGGFITVSIGITPFGLERFMSIGEGEMLAREVAHALKVAYSRYLDGSLDVNGLRPTKVIMEERK